jgi:hypothetical protein
MWQFYTTILDINMRRYMKVYEIMSSEGIVEGIWPHCKSYDLEVKWVKPSSHKKESSERNNKTDINHHEELYYQENIVG